MATCSDDVLVDASIAMATYNGAEYLEEQLDSFARQTVLPTELVVSDDASTDATREILAEFSRHAPFRVRIRTSGKTLGYAENFQRAVRSCVGGIVFFADQDDVWLPNKIERVRRRFATNPFAQLVIHDRLVVDSKLRGIGVSSLSAVKACRATIESYVAGSATAVRRALLELAIPFPRLVDGTVGHDEWVHRLARSLCVADVLDEALMLYRRHGDNVSRSYTVEASFGVVRTKFGEVQSALETLGSALSGRRHTRLFALRQLELELMTRLRRPEAATLGCGTSEALSKAAQRVEVLSRRLEVLDGTFPCSRIREAKRAHRAGAYATTARGLASLVFDVVATRGEIAEGIGVTEEEAQEHHGQKTDGAHTRRPVGPAE